MKVIGIFPNLSKDKVVAALGQIVDLCRSNGLEPLLPSSIALQYGCRSFSGNSLEQLDYAVSLGGDGTLLEMARHVAPKGIPVFGINFGKLGFLAEIDAQAMEAAFSRLGRGDFSLEERALLKASVLQNGHCITQAHALNDLVLTKGAFSKLAHFQLYINGKVSGTYAGDGLIIATATGSTAYSLSAGGPLVMPQLEVSVITPICAHSLTARALVIPLSEAIELRAVPGSEEMLLSADGEMVAPVYSDTLLQIAKSPYTVRFIRLTERDYYETWQQKLMRNL